VLLLQQVPFPLSFVLVLKRLSLFKAFSENGLALHLIQLVDDTRVYFIFVQVFAIKTKF
jgi:hypothetical protein